MKTFLSPRGKPLVFYTDGGFPKVHTVTVENYLKWYSLYIVSPRGVVTEVDDYDLMEQIASDLGTYWMGDHVFNPDCVAEYCRRMGYHLCTESLEMIIGRWCREALNQWDKTYV